MHLSIFKRIFLVFLFLLINQVLWAKLPSQDLNRDGKVDITDLALFLEHWLTGDITADFDGNGRVNLDDFATFEQYWLKTFSPLVINEVLASNASILRDPLGQYSDYIEIYNPGPLPLDMAGMYLSDSKNNLTRWQFPLDNSDYTTIPAGGYKLIWANGAASPYPTGQHLWENIALQAIATASSVGYGWLPEYGIDDDVSTGYHSVESADDHWYEIDLLAEYQLDMIELVNRPGFLARLNGAIIKVLDGNRNLIFASLPVSDSPLTVTEDNDGQGFENIRYIRVEKSSLEGNPLTIMELRAFRAGSVDSSALLCANFSLKAAGEEVYLVDTDGLTIIDELAFVNQQTDTAWGRIPDGSDNLSLMVATPNAPNADAWLGVVADTKFTHKRGFYDEPFSVAISSTTPDAQIYYTLDGTAPTQESTLYIAPFAIDKTTCLRARAFKDGYLPTNIDTQTYVFNDQVINQPANPQGFPAYWKNIAADYEMATDITTNPLYSDYIQPALKALPVISIVTDNDNLFDDYYGIYANSGSHAYTLSDGTIRFEVPASIEYFNDENKSDFQVDCGLRIQGGYFRRPDVTTKHSFRLLFKSMYGPAKLGYPLFDYDKDAAKEFNTIVLRAGANDGYSWDAGRFKAQYLRDEFMRRLQQATGNAASHGIFVHLYVNGLYWGLYNAVERPDNEFSASYYGGDAEQWDTFKHTNFEQNNGDNADALNQMRSLAQQAASSNEAYQLLQGNNPDGSRNPNYPIYMDVDNYIAYMLLNIWGGNWDWPWNNYWLGRDSSAASTGFKFYCWDAEDTIDSVRSPLSYNKIAAGLSQQVGSMHTHLAANLEYRTRFGDYVHRCFFNEGILTPDFTTDLYQTLAAIIELPMIAESARWGDIHSSSSVTVQYWQNQRDAIINTYLPQRSDIVLSQLTAAGLYPTIAAAVFSIDGKQQTGGIIQINAQLQIDSASDGQIFYCSDGSDPRLPGGLINPDAIAYNDPVNIASTTHIKARTYSNGSWSALNEAVYITGAVFNSLRISELMYHPAGGSAFREAEWLELQNIGTETINLNMVAFTDGIDYQFGDIDLAPGAFIVLAKNSTMFYSQNPDFTGNIVFGYDGMLSNSGENLILQDAQGNIIADFTYSDQWYPDSDGQGFSLTVLDINANNNLSDKASWQLSTPTPGR